jgi:hypothetical protein
MDPTVKMLASGHLIVLDSSHSAETNKTTKTETRSNNRKSNKPNNQKNPQSAKQALSHIFP